MRKMAVAEASEMSYHSAPLRFASLGLQEGIIPTVLGLYWVLCPGRTPLPARQNERKGRGSLGRTVVR